MLRRGAIKALLMDNASWLILQVGPAPLVVDIRGRFFYMKKESDPDTTFSVFLSGDRQYRMHIQLMPSIQDAYPANANKSR